MWLTVSKSRPILSSEQDYKSREGNNNTNKITADIVSFIQAYNNALPGEIMRRPDSGHEVMVSDFRSNTEADL
ncbi:hypothetical protein XPA_000408 [Xanthoria parietina]